jgi:predicted component of type VI protein secretion system
LSFGERLLGSLKTIVLLEERNKLLDEALRSLKAKVETTLADHEKRLTRLETIVEITRPDGGVLRITRGAPD